MSLDSLPPELLLDIFELAAPLAPPSGPWKWPHRPRAALATLSACALVCSTWTPAAQRLIFDVVNIRAVLNGRMLGARPAVCALLVALEDGGGRRLGALVHTLVLPAGMPHGTYDDDMLCAARIVSLCPCVRVVTLVLFPVVPKMVNDEVLQLFGRSRNVRCLALLAKEPSSRFMRSMLELWPKAECLQAEWAPTTNWPGVTNPRLRRWTLMDCSI